MIVLKCKMCGGDLNFEDGVTVVECEYCGTKQTVPTIDDEKKITLFSRANRLRFACEFDKASGVYESIVADFPEEAEAYWGLVLCKYGIEYVDDPATGKKIPTCHRSSFENVMEDENFEQVLENADPIARAVYREEVKQIEELRRGIIEVSNKEEPYDIFICYKETAESGERTIDSVIAQDVYHELTEKGYRVFFSRITLEDKLGQEYEPYIFAALNSAKIMLAFGTDYEYYNAVWVKNEWSRFLQLIAKGEKKTLIPCYKNIDAYDMPKEFARLQAQDMGKIGAMQDLLRGIEKLLPRNDNMQVAQVNVQQAQSATVESLLKRAYIYLEDGDWKNAVDYCNRVLDISPENVEAYVGLLMAELKVRKDEELAHQTVSFGQNKHFIKAIRFSTEERRNVLEGYRKAVEDYQREQLRIAEEKRKRSVEEMRRQEEERRRQEEERRKEEERRRLEEEHRQQLQEKRQALEKTAYLIAAGRNHAIGVKSDGTIITAKGRHYYNFNVYKVKKWKDIVAVTATNDKYLVGLKSDGTVIDTNCSPYGYICKRKRSKWRDIVAVSAANYLVVGLKSDGTVVVSRTRRADKSKGKDKEVYKHNDLKNLQYGVSKWKDIIAVATSLCLVMGFKGGYALNRIVGLKSNGTVLMTMGRLSKEVSGWEEIVAVAAGFECIVGLKLDGTVVTTERHMSEKVSGWRDIVAVAASPVFANDDVIVGLKLNGTVVTTNENMSKEVSEWRDIVAVACTSGVIAGLKSDGSVVEIQPKGQSNVLDWKLF